MGNNGYDVFISYSRADTRYAADIDSALRQKGLRTFFDRRDLAPGLPWIRALEEAIGASKAAIILLGPSGLGDTQQYERELAFVRQTGEPNFPVVPVVLPDTRDPPFNFLRVVTWVDFSHVAKILDAPDQLQRLLTAVQTRLEGAKAAHLDICPYRGLDAFREDDSAFFFGRGSANDPASPIGQLVAKVRALGFVMIVGRSGSGKSSLVYAGLVPALRREVNRFWNVLSLRPGPEPLRSLAAAFNPRTEGEGAAEYATKITKEAEGLRNGDPDMLSHMIREELAKAEGKPDRLLLYIDQWEELYAQAQSSGDPGRPTRHAGDVDRFIDLLLGAARSAPVTVVGTVRADFYDPLIGHPQIRALLPDQQVLLGSMTRSELESTIVEPARIVGLTFDPQRLVERILDDAGADEGMLPLLQYALKETWNQRERNRLTGDSYARSGGVREAIRITAERTFEALSPADQQAARQLFLRLVIPGEGQEDTRARAAMPTESGQIKIIEQFASPRTRLLVTGLNRAKRPTVEVAHEALIRTWPRLRTWIDANREKLRSRVAVLQAKTEWEENSRRDDMLLPAGLQLERARGLLADPGDITTDDIRDFISLSFAREEAERKQREDALARDEARVAQIKASQERTARLQRNTRWAFAAVAAVILIASAIIGYIQWDKAQQLSADQARNAALRDSLNKRQLDLDHAEANFLGQLSETKLSRGEISSALRLASRGTRVDLALPSDAVKASTAAAALAAAVWQASWRLVVWHDAPVHSAAFSPDGSRIVTASEDKTARIWDAATTKEIAVLRGHEGIVWFAAFSPDGSRIVTASADKTARIWDAATAKEIAVLRGHDLGVLSASFSPDGLTILTSSSDATSRVWDASTAGEIAVLRGHSNGVLSATFSPDGSRIVTAGYDHTARIWDTATAKEIAVLRGHTASVQSVIFSPDGSRIVSASWDKTARIWDAATARQIAVLSSNDLPVNYAAFSPDGSRIVTASADKTARIWDVATAKEVVAQRGHTLTVWSAVFSPDGSHIVTASADKSVRIWDAAIATEIAVLRGHGYGVDKAAFSPDGWHVVTTSTDGIARIWNIAPAKEIAILSGQFYGLVSAAFSPDGKHIVARSGDKYAHIWDIATTTEIGVLRGHVDFVNSAVFSPDGSRIVTASADKTARIWDAATAKEIGVLRGHDDFVKSAVFSSAGSRIVTASTDKTARIWDAATAKEIAVLRGHENIVNSAVFSPDGSRIVTASQDHTARIWDAATATEIAVLRGHDNAVLSAAFSPDGFRIITASWDKTARIWDAATATEIAVLGHMLADGFAAFGPDGSRVVTTSDDKTARIWDTHLLIMSAKELLAEACRQLASSTRLTRDEMRLAGHSDNAAEIDVCQ